MIALRYFCNGVRVPAEEYVISAEDEGLTRGRAVFETMRTFQGRLFRARQHTVRLVASAEAVGVPTLTSEELARELEGAIEGYEGGAKVNMVLTGGGQRLIRVGPLDMDRYGATLRVATRSWEPPPWLDGRSKHCSRAMNQAAVRQAGVDEVFWVGEDGTITEGTRANVFAVIGGILMTPPDDGRILAGVTRGALIDAAREGGLELKEVSFPPDATFDELYATSTLRDLGPVTEIDGRPLPKARPVGKRLRAALRQLMERECGISPGH